MNTDIFRAYDIRGIFDVDFHAKDFYQIARAYADQFQPKNVAVGYDVRQSSPELCAEVAAGFRDSGVNVLDLGCISTDMLYFAVVHYHTDGGIVISASHNPAPYNGMKLVRQHASPVSADTGLLDLRDTLEKVSAFEKPKRQRGTRQLAPFLSTYLAHLRTFVDLKAFAPKRIVINANSGLAGQIAECLLADTPIQVCKRLFVDPDGSFAQIPGGRPDPLRPENRELTATMVNATRADLAAAWDADADRCFFFDENGVFVESCYIAALLADRILQQKGSGDVIFDPRTVWPVENTVISANGVPVLNRCGHSFIKTRMRETNAVFAGESSGHYYFRNNFYADNGMIPFLLILEYLSLKGISLAESVQHLREKYPVSGEINFSFETKSHIQDALAAINDRIHRWGNPNIEAPIDGLSVRFLSNKSALPRRSSWRFNLRESNTEPLLRLNIETIADEALLIEQTTRISDELASIGGNRETKFRWEHYS